jgi:NAD(P)-dependent dehydrogenase (short-subunit alcohol dehydrogenase family)
MLLSNQVAVITGGAKGIGKGIALQFAREGCSIVIVDLAAEEAKKTLEEISETGSEGIFIPCDVTSNAQIQDMARQAIEKYQKIDILVNNAGGLFQSRWELEDVSEEQWDKTLDLNLKSQFLACKAIVPHMKKMKYGRIINMSSMGAISPPTSVIHYHSAKAGVLGLTCNLAVELAPYNICVNAILPGPIRTNFWDPLTSELPDEDAFFADVAKNEVPLQRIGTPQDIAGAALYLASDLASFVTGATINVSGGLPLHLSTRS